MIGKDKYAHRLRKINLQHLFGDVFDEIYCGDFTKSKKIFYNQNIKILIYIWIDDRIDYAKDGQEVGLKTYLYGLAIQ